MTQQERDEIRALVMSFSTRISDLPEVQSLSDADYITVVQDDGSKKHSKKATFQALLQLLKIHYPDNNGAKYQGIAHPADQNVTLPIGTDGFWFAIDAGIYTNYGGITVGNCPKVIRYDVVSHEWSSDDLWGDINGTIGFCLKPGVTPNSLDTFRIPVRPNGSYLIDVDSLPAGALGSTVVSEFDYDGNLLKRTELESLPLDFIPQTGTDYIQVTLGYNSSNPIDIEHSEVTMSSSVKVLIEGLYNFIVDVLQGEYEAKFDNIESDITSILSRLSTAENAIQQLRTDVESLRDDIDGLSSRIDGIDGQIGELGTGLDSLNTRLQETIDNIQLTVDGIWARFEDDEGYISDLQLTARLFQVRLSDAEGNISTLRQTAEEISAQVENAQGDIALLYIRADEIGTRVTNAEGDISTLTQRADDITAQVQNAQGDIATLQITAAQISSTVQNMQGDMSVLEQTAQQISARVTNVEGDVSELYITANEIGSRVTDAEGNISTLTQTSTALTARLEDAEGDITALEVTANGLSTRITNTEGDISTLQLTASSLESRIENAEGDISTLTQTAESISARVSNTENDISELNITAGEISARVSDAEDNISALEIRADGIEARVSDNEDNIASLELTAEGLTTRVSDAEGDISTLQQTATSLTSRITDAEGDISTLEQTATSLTSRISTVEGNITTINQDIDSIELSVSTISTNLTNYEALTDAALSNLQDQIDGVVQTWYAEGVPTLSNYPANEWDADEKPNHIGDLYYDKLTGKAYRFMLDGSQEPPVYVWTLIADEDVAKALALAGEKKRVFVTTPYPPYDAGDLWVKERTVNNVTTREIYKCVTSRAVGDTINLDTDWVTADNYGYQVNKANLEVLTNKIVGKVTQITYNQDGTISSQSASLIEQNANEIKLQVANGAIDDALDSGGSINSALLPTGIDITNEKVIITANHFYLKGNNAGTDAALVLVYKDNVPKISVVNLDVTGVFQTTEWSTQVTNLNTTAQGYADTAESNANSYADGVGASTLDDAKDYSDGNLQLAKDYADNIETSAINTAEDYFNTIVYGNGGTAEHPTSGSILYTINNLGDEYTTLNNQINVGDNSLVSQINTLSGHLTDMGYLAEALLNGRTVIGGGLILSSLIQLGSNPGGQNWQVWSGINGVYDSSAYGNGIAAWYGGAMLDRHYSGNTDANRAARSLFRFDGSGYLANQKIRWDYDNNDVKLVIDGYVLTHEVQLGYTDQSDVWHTMAGISGSYDATDAANGYGIAAWYGGEKIDRKKTPSATNGATSLFRFDGSGYLANRQIEWGASGELIIHGQSTENPITIENAVLTQGNLSVTIGDLLELKSWFVKEAFTIPGDSTTHYRLKLVGSTTGLEGLHVEGHILSDADQIVGAGTPGGGGGSGTTPYSTDLLDFIQDLHPSAGKMLVWTATGTNNAGTTGGWTLIDKSSVGVTTNASQSAAGLMSSADKIKLDAIEVQANKYVLPVASASVLGGIKVGSGLSINASTGVLDATYTYTLPLAANGTRGGIQIGYSSSGKNYAVQLSSEKAYVNVPWTDTTYKLTLNGTVKGTTGGTDLGSFYAPTSSGTSGHVLISGGANTAPSFRALVANDIPDISNTYVTLATAQTISGSKTFSSSQYFNEPIRVRKAVYGAYQLFESKVVKEIVIYTKIPYASGTYFPYLRFTGNPYSERKVFDMGLEWYIYNGEFYNPGCVNLGSFPAANLYLFSYTADGNEYVAIGMTPTVVSSWYYFSFNIDVYSIQGGATLSASTISGWSHIGIVSTDTEHTNIPAIGTNHCVLVPTKPIMSDISADAIYANTNGSILGESSKRWKIYGTTGDFSSSVTATALYVTANGGALGTASKRWALYATTGNFSGAISASSTLGVTGATTLSSTLAVTGLATLSGGATIPSGKTLKIGDATIEWVANSGNGYLKIDKPLLTVGDQIVGSGTPSGGGGSASYLSDLLDLSETITDKPTGGGYGLVYSTSATDKNGNSGAWIYVASGTTANISGANTTVRLWSGNTIKSAIEAYGYLTTTTAASTYVKLSPGTSEQTISSSISSFVKGVINLWRSSGDHYTFLGFSNGTTETYLGGIGFKSQSDHNLYHKDGSNYYTIFDENNYTSYVNTTNFPGLNKTGTVTSVKVGSTSYSPSSGVVSLPAYPTTLPASDVSAWAKAATKPSYTLDEVSDGSTRKLSNYVPTTRTVNSKALSSNITLTLDDIGNGSTRSLSNYVLKAGDTMSGDLIIEKTGGGLTIRGERLNSNANGGYIYLAARYLNGERNGCKIAAEYPGSGAYDVQDLVFYSSDNRSGDAAPIWKEAMRIKADTSVTIGQAESITMKNGGTIKVIDNADTPSSLSALYMSSNNNLIIGYGTTTAGYNTYIYGNELSFRYGTSPTIGMRVNSSGNVTIGATDLAGTTSKLYVDGALVATTVNGYTLAAACAKGVVTSMTASSTSTNLPTAAAVASLVSEYLPLAGGTMTGSIKLPNGEYINADSGYAMCGIGSGGETFYCGPGAEITNAFYIRSGNINLTHVKAGTNYTIWDASNSNLSTVDWAANNLTAAGIGTFDRVVLSNTGAVSHIEFTRAGWNYISTPTNGVIAFNTGGSGSANTSMAVTPDGIRPGTTAVHSCGLSTAYWGSIYGQDLYLGGDAYNTAAGSIIFSEKLSDQRNGFKIAPVHATSANRVNLVFYRSNVGSSPYAPNWTTFMTLSYDGKATIAGSLTTSGDQTISSDATLKTNWKELNYTVKDIANAKIGIFDWKDGHGTSAGSVAQDWKKLIPELVHGDEGNMTLAYGQIALLNTVMLARRSEDHETRIKALEAENAKLKEEIKRLKS